MKGGVGGGTGMEGGRREGREGGEEGRGRGGRRIVIKCVCAVHKPCQPTYPSDVSLLCNDCTR